jgi:acyl dehydratase
MPLDYRQLMQLAPREWRSAYSQRDVILYALGVSSDVAADGSTDYLRDVYERELRVLPTMAVVLGDDNFWLMDSRYGLDWIRILHGEQGLQLHRPLAVAGEVISRQRIDQLFDRGADKGAMLLASKQLFDAGSGELLATMRSTWILRGDGGFGGERGKSAVAHRVPDHRAADITLAANTHPQQALLYRLSGDRNPLHVDPSAARQGGFERPILHGLCTYGIVARLLLGALCDNDALRFLRFDVRFSNPVYPGESLQIDIWHERPGVASVRARCAQRDVTVIDNGLFEYTVKD